MSLYMFKIFILHHEHLLVLNGFIIHSWSVHVHDMENFRTLTDSILVHKLFLNSIFKEQFISIYVQIPVMIFLNTVHEYFIIGLKCTSDHYSQPLIWFLEWNRLWFKTWHHSTWILHRPGNWSQTNSLFIARCDNNN